MKKQKVKTKLIIAGRYEVVRELGKGGMGRVLLVKDRHQDDSLLALKIMTDAIRDEPVAKRFVNEFKLLKRLNRPELVQVYDYGVSEEIGVYFTMEYVPWKDIVQLDDKLTTDQKLLVLYELANSLSILHSSHIVHFDLKTDNVFVDFDTMQSNEKFEQSLVKLGDLGMAGSKLIERDEDRRGSFFFSAPELLIGDKADHRSDIYSFAMIGLNLALGNEEFMLRVDGMTSVSKKCWLPDPADFRNAGFPEPLVSALCLCLNPDVGFRPHSIDEVKSTIVASESNKYRTSYRPRFNFDFIGRKGSMRFLGSMFHNVCQGEQWIFQISGEKAIGKSKLMEEFALQKQVEGNDIVRLEGDNFTPLIKYFASVNERNQSSDELGAYDLNLNPEIILLHSLDAGLGSRPLIVCWMSFDESTTQTQLLMKKICLKFKKSNIMWLLECGREPKSHLDLTYTDRYVRHQLKPLSSEAVAEFTGSALGHALGWEILGKQIHALCRGKPDWAKYIINNLFETGQIVHSKHKWFILSDELDLDNTDIDKIVIDSLKKTPRPSKWVLEWLAVLDSPITVDELKNILEISDPDWITNYRLLNEFGFLQVINGVVLYQQPLLREVVYKNIPAESRSRLHHLVGSWLEDTLSVSNDFTALQRITHHYHIADEKRSFLRMIRKLLDISGNARNIDLKPELFETALKNFRRNLKQAHQYRCVELLANYNLRLKNFELAAGLFKHLIDARAFKNLEYPGFLELRLGLCYSSMSKYGKAESILNQAILDLIKFDKSAAGDAISILAKMYYKQRKLAKSNEILDNYLKLISSIKNDAHKLSHEVRCSLLLKNNNRFEQAIGLLEKIRHENPNPWRSKEILRAYKAEIEISFYRNDWQRIQSILQIMEMANSKNYSSNQEDYLIIFYRLSIQLLKGQVARGIDNLEDLMQTIRMQVEPSQQASMMLNLIRYYFNAGLYWKGMGYIRRGMKLSRRADSVALQAVYIVWAARFRAMNGKSSNRLIDYAARLMKLRNDPAHEYMVYALLVDHYWLEDNTEEITKPLNALKKLDKNVKVDYPKPLYDLHVIWSKLNQGNSSDLCIDLDDLDSKLDSISDILYKGQYNHLLMVIAAKFGKRSKANDFFKLALMSYRKTNAMYMIARCQEDYSQICLGWGDTDEAELNLIQASQTYRGLNLPVPSGVLDQEISQVNKIKDEADMAEGHRLRELAEILEMLNNLEDPDQITRKLLEVAVNSVGATRGLIFFKTPRMNKLAKRASLRIGAKEEIEISRTIVEKVFTSGLAIFHNNALTDNYLSSLESVQLNKIRALACLPILSRGNIEGALYLDNLGSAKKFDETEKSYLALQANVIGLILTHAQLIHVLKDDLVELKLKIDHLEGYNEFKGRSKAIQRIYEMLHYIKDSDTPVLILGESGTGKELVARIINRQSVRANMPFFAINCAALPEPLLDSMLFGHCRGSFTDAKSDHAGFFEQASGGTIFLDEVDEMSMSMQGKLLRVLQEGEFYRLGETEMRKTDVRIIAAGKDYLPKLVEEGKFREDLYFRLYVVKLVLPPLRDRTEDIPLLTKYFLTKYGNQEEEKIGLTNAANTAILRYEWPGNIRQLENTIRGALIFARSKGKIDIEHLPDEIRNQKTADLTEFCSLREQMERIEEDHIRKALKLTNGNRNKAANLLGIHRSTLVKKMKSYVND